METTFDADPWKRDVAGFVEPYLPDAPCRVLDVGCGEGWLSFRLARVGYEVRGIDPEAPEGPLFERVTLEEFRDPGAFDAVVAILSLHHILDLQGAVDRILNLLAPAGSLVAVEFAWDRIDDATAQWALDRLPAQLEEDNWLQKRCMELRERFRSGRRLNAHSHFQRWATEEGLHPSSEMLEELRRRFSERFFSWDPYLYPELEGVTQEEERAAIETGAIQPMGFRFVGERAYSI
jgi:SAM-dependent methyltransferase